MRRVITEAAARCPGVRVEIKRLLLATAWQPDARSAPLVQALQRHGEAVFGEPIPTSGTPLYTDVRLYAAAGVPAAIYGAGPRTVLESNAKRADEHLVLEDEMFSKLLTPTICALAIFVFGAGLEPVVADEGSADPAAFAELVSGEAPLRVLPTVTVVAQTPAEGDTDTEGSVVLANVQRAGDEIAQRVTTGVRRVSLAVPYYAFGGVARRASE